MAELLGGCPIGNAQASREIANFTGKTDFFSLSQLWMPVNLGGCHWLLAAIDFIGERFVILDSMAARQSYETVFNLLAAIVQHEEANRFAAAAGFSTASWAACVGESRDPAAGGGGDPCGVFILMFARCLSRRKPPAFLWSTCSSAAANSSGPLPWRHRFPLQPLEVIEEWRAWQRRRH
ncbi:unnamed protein product [Phaeothamnion confervicola]